MARLRIRDKALLPFIFHQGSLTSLIQQHCHGRFEVELKSEAWRFPMTDEAKILNMNNRSCAFIRESWLKTDDQYLVYARSVIPRKTFRLKSRQFINLGNSPLGEVLFADKSGYRSSMRYAMIPGNCTLFRAALGSGHMNQGLWARQSLFYIRNSPLLIIEVFLPAIKQCIQN